MTVVWQFRQGGHARDLRRQDGRHRSASAIVLARKMLSFLVSAMLYLKSLLAFIFLCQFSHGEASIKSTSYYVRTINTSKSL